MNDQKVKEKLFIIDDQFQIYKIEESEEGNEPYDVSLQQNLVMSEYRELSHELRQLKSLPWSRVSITDNCITMNGITLDFKDGYSWKLVSDEKLKDSTQQWTVKSC